jgi:hypothetical protein
VTRASEALSLARGDVRDGVAAIAHFLQVLGSRRVGSRALARAVPEVLAGCIPLRTALAALDAAQRGELAADPEGMEAASALIARALACVDELAAALRAHERASSLDARERLALEAVVRAVAAELSTVVRLFDLLGATVTSETTTIDLFDALAQRRAHHRPGTTAVHMAVESHLPELTVGNARLVLELLDLGVATVIRAGVTSPRVVVDRGAEGFPVLMVEEGSPPPEAGAGSTTQVLDVILRPALPREIDVIRAAARHAGLTVNVSDDRRRVTIAL